MRTHESCPLMLSVCFDSISLRNVRLGSLIAARHAADTGCANSGSIKANAERVVVGAVGALSGLPVEEVESFLIRKALTRYSNNVSQAAGALGLSRSALYRRMQRYGI